MAFILVPLVIGIAFSLLAALLAPKPKQSMQSFGPASTTTRGSVVPLVLGCRRVGANIAWVGDRKVIKVKQGGGSNFGGPSGYEYHESGWHQLCVGPAYGLNKIVRNGKVIWDTPIDRFSTPSGSLLLMKDKSKAYIFWGEPDQPVNTYLGDASRVGVSSRWPFMCYILWNSILLGVGTPTWPNIEYEITTADFTRQFLVGSSPWIIKDSGDDNDGQNPAHAAWQVLTGLFPHGIGIAPEELDTATFEQFGVFMQDEHLPLNAVAENGRQAGDFIASMMQDYGFVLSQIKGQISPVIIRDTTEYGSDVTVGASCLSSSTVIERSQNYDDTVPDRIVFLFKSRLNNFRDFDVQVDDDAVYTQRNSSAFRQVTLDNVIDAVTANRVARRKILEVFTNPEVYSITVLRGARRLYPGQRFVLDGVGVVRVGTIQWDQERPETRMEVALDQYATAYGDYLPSGIDYIGNVNPDVADADLAVVAMELPWGSVSGRISISVIRLRNNDTVVAASIYASLDPAGPYVLIGSQDTWGEGGTLTTTMASGTGILASGPHFEELNTDTADALDLTGDPGWENGRQIVIIGDELGYLEHITALDATHWQLENIRRAKEGTSGSSHAVGDYVFIQDRTSITMLVSDLFTPGVTVYVKSVPSTSSDTVDITTVTPITLTLRGSLAPYIPSLFKINGGTTFGTGTALVFTWTHTVQNGASVVEGFFRIRIWDHVGGTLKDTRDTAGDEDTLTVSNADLVSDFVTEPASFYAELTCVSPDGGTESTPALTLSVTRV